MSIDILAIVAHPDDETFGCGGALALHSDMGYRVGVLCLTCSPPDRRGELQRAADVLGVESLEVFDDKHPLYETSFIKRVTDVIVSIRPRLVITHNGFDYHREHRRVNKVVAESIEWAAHATAHDEPWIVERLLLMEVNTLIPHFHVLVDISEVMERKLEAIELYRSQLEKFTWGYYQKFNKKKAELRGIQGNCDYAEAYMEEPLSRNSPFYPNRSTDSLL